MRLTKIVRSQSACIDVDGLTQYGKCSYVLDPGAGGIRGTSTRNTLDKKNKMMTILGARNGGSQFHALYVEVYRSKRPTETRALMIARQYDDTDKALRGQRC